MTNLLAALDKIYRKDSHNEERYLVTGINWQQYEYFFRSLDYGSQRISYLDGTLEIMSPSRDHEIIKKNLARLLEIYFEETQTPFVGLGSTTLKSEDKQAAKEPDECYCLGIEKEFPDLAIEVVKTSGGINTLAIYQRLGVQEVWIWQNNQLAIYGLRGDKYELLTKSELLNDLDLQLLRECVNQTDILTAIKSFRAKIRG